MGTYLSVAVATTIYIRKNSSSETIDSIKDNLDQNFDLSNYSIKSSEKYFVLDLKSKIFEEEILNLMQEIVNTLPENLKSYTNEDIEEIKGKKISEILKLAEEHPLGFQYLEGSIVCNDISYLLKGHSGFADVIDLINDGKILMECYSDMFYFLRTNLVKALRTKLRKSIVITIIG